MIDSLEFLNIPWPPTDANSHWTGFFDYGAPWGDTNHNPWQNGRDPLISPFDEEVGSGCVCGG